MKKKRYVGIIVLGVIFCLMGLWDLSNAVERLSKGFLGKSQIRDQISKPASSLGYSDEKIDELVKVAVSNARRNGVELLIFSFAFLIPGIGIMLRKNWARVLSLIWVWIFFAETVRSFIVDKSAANFVVCILSLGIVLPAFKYLTRIDVKEQFIYELPSKKSDNTA